MDATTANAQGAAAAVVMTPGQLLDHWQGHRRLTRRVIEAFPEDTLFTYAIGGMRPFSAFVMEFLGMAVPIARGVATGSWGTWGDDTNPPTTKAELLRRWDEATEELNRVWAALPVERFQEVHTAFGQWTGKGYWQIFYAIDNEIHHRAQGYVYLRSLGIEPPAFYDRS